VVLVEALAEVGDDLVAHPAAAVAPAARTDEVLRTIVQPVETKELGGLAELLAHFLAEAREEEEFAAGSGFSREGGQARFRDGAGGRSGGRRRGGGGGFGEADFGCDESEGLEDFFEGGGEFRDGNNGLLALDFEVVEDGEGGLFNEVVIDLLDGLADDFDADVFDGARDVLAVGGLKYQAVGM
jgi:hypothetical protein